MRKNTQKGITIIEVLVAMLILAVGLLGMASLQVRSVQDTGNSNLRSVAIYLANDMADRIRANNTAMAAGNYNSVAGASLTANCLTTTGCSSAAMANHDMQEWLTNLGNSLPNGDGEIDRDGDLFEITVTWDERVRQTNADGDAVNIATGTVTLTFEP